MSNLETQMLVVQKQRTPPYNHEVEQALLGGLLHNNLALEKVSDFLAADHFASAAHRTIYNAILKLVQKGQIANPITLKTYLEKEETLNEVGGVAYLVQLADAVSGIVDIKDYGLLLYDLYLRRSLINIGEDIVNDAHTLSVEEEAIHKIEDAEKKLYDLATQGRNEGGFVDFKSSLASAIESAEIAFKRDSQVVGCTTGLRDVDKWLGGLHPSDLLILAGRPSMGKTALATNIGFNAALGKLERDEGGAVGFFSLEMSAEQLALRLLSQESGIPSDKIRRGEIHKNDFPKFIEVSRRISNIPFHIDDTPALSIAQLRARARRLQRQKGLDLIIVDYLQLLRGTSGGRDENRVQEISEITRGLKALAKELHVPVIALSQLSRAVEQRDDKRPQLADLRESGSIEQDADVVLFVYREEYYESRKEPDVGSDKHAAWQEKMSRIYNQADLIIAKQRHGPIGNIKLFFDGKLTKFGNLND